MVEDGASHPLTYAIRQRDAAAPFAIGADPRSWGQLLADAGAVARHLGRARARGDGLLTATTAVGTTAVGTTAVGMTAAIPRAELMVACQDRYASAVALLGCWQAGYVVALPPNGNPTAIDELCAARGIELVLHDGGGGDGRADARGSFDVRTAMGAPFEGPPSDLITFAGTRPLVCVYTSGSTGDPLPCLKTAGQILGEALLLVELFSLGSEARVLATVPPYHIYGLLFGLLVPLMGGGVVVRATPHHAETIAEMATSCRANVLVSVPAHLHGLGALSVGALPPFARVFSSGAPLPPATAAQAAVGLGRVVTEVYGSSETGGVAWRHGGTNEGWRPFPGVSVDVSSDGTIVIESPFAPGGDGLGGDGLDGDGGEGGDGERPGRAARFVGGDRIALRGDGRFDLLGRVDGVVKIGGSRTSTGELERRLLEIPGVRDAAVVSVDVPGPRQHELWAAVAGTDKTVVELRAALLRVVDPISMPRRFRIVAALPREDNGKLARERVLALFAAHPAHRGAAAERHTAEVHFPADSPYFRGHFSGFPVLPGVVQVNQLVLRQIRARWSDLRHLRRIIGLKFRSPIRPGDTVSIETTRASDARQVAFRLLATGGSVVSSGKCVFQADSARGESVE